MIFFCEGEYLAFPSPLWGESQGTHQKQPLCVRLRYDAKKNPAIYDCRPLRMNQHHHSHNICHGKGIIRENVTVAENTWRLALVADEKLPLIAPGQFVMLRLPNASDPLLGRPLAVYHTDDERQLEVVYVVVGKMTRRLSQLRAGAELEFWTPLGNGFLTGEEEGKIEHTIMVAGGIGQTPFFMLCGNAAHESTVCENMASKKKGHRKTLLYGARTANRLACVDDFKRTGTDVRIATDDGSAGYHGVATDLIELVYRPGETTQILGCGPMPMLRAAFDVAQRLELPCRVSLETPMSCGLGICFGCVVKYRNVPDDAESGDGGFDYKRTCVDGPVFDAYRLYW